MKTQTRVEKHKRKSWVARIAACIGLTFAFVAMSQSAVAAFEGPPDGPHNGPEHGEESHDVPEPDEVAERRP